MTSPVTFLSETFDELKKVTWPTQQQVLRLTVVVIIVSIMVGIYIGALDTVFTAGIQILFKTG